MSLTPAQKSAPSFDNYPAHQYDNRPVTTLQRSYPVSGRSISFDHALPRSTPDAPVQRRRASKTPKRNLSTKHRSDSSNHYESDPRRVSTVSSLSVPKHSRLPPKHVARKVPRKSITSAAQLARPSLKLSQKRSNLDATQHRIPASSTVLPNPRDLESSDDDDDIPLAVKRSRAVTKAGVSQHEILQSIEPGEVGTALQQRPQASKLPMKSSDVTAVAKMVSDTRPWNYYVPPELDGVRQALNKDDWNEYVSLVQKVLVQEIAREKLHAFTRRTFQVSNAKMYKKIESMVAEMIFGSALELCSVESEDKGDE